MALCYFGFDFWKLKFSKEIWMNEKKIYKFDIVIQLYSKLCTPKKHNGMFEEMVLKQASFMNKKNTESSVYWYTPKLQ